MSLRWIFKNLFFGICYHHEFKDGQENSYQELFLNGILQDKFLKFPWFPLNYKIWTKFSADSAWQKKIVDVPPPPPPFPLCPLSLNLPTFKDEPFENVSWRIFVVICGWTGPNLKLSDLS